MNRKWITNVRELLVIFKEAITSIIPSLEKARINWKDGETYDEWDNIVESIFENIVFSTFIGEVLSEYNIAKYDFYYEDYSNINYIGVRNKEYLDKKFAFVSFQIDLLPIINIKVAELDELEKVISHTNLRFDDVEFYFVKNNEGKKEYIDTIEITI